MILIGLWSALAGELATERARTALDEGDPQRALAAAWEAVGTAGDGERWDAWTALLRACAAAGLDPACRAEAALSEHPEASAAAAALDGGPGAHAPQRAVQGAQLAGLAKSAPDRAAAQALQLRVSHPDWPDLALPLFDPTMPPQKSVTSARAKIVKAGVKRLAKGGVPAPELYRWHRVFVAGASPAAVRSADALAAAGEPRPLDRRPWTRPELVQRATALAAQPAEDFGTALLAEREGLVLRLAEQLQLAGRRPEALDVLARARAEGDTASLALAQAHALREAGDPARAIEAASAALDLAVSAWPTDLAAHDRLARKAAAAQALAARGQARLAALDHGGATVDLILANQLVREPLAAGDLERALSKGWFALEQLKARLETRRASAAELALAAARDAAAAQDWPAVRASADQAVQLFAMPTQRKARPSARLPGLPELAESLALRGLAEARTGGSGLADLGLATLILPFSSPSDWWATLAEQRADQPYAAYFARAMADATAEASDPGLAAAWPGGTGGGQGAGPALVAAWMVGDPALEPPSDRIVVERGRVRSFPRPGAAGQAARPDRPRVNEPFPAFSVDTGHGQAGWRPGRALLLTFFRSDSASSRQAATDLTVLARDLRKLGLDVAWMGVVIDPDRAGFDRLGTERESWGSTAWDPSLGARFGVSAVPTTWVLDAQGIARFHHVGYLGPAEYEAEIRFISGL